MIDLSMFSNYLLIGNIVTSITCLMLQGMKTMVQTFSSKMRETIIFYKKLNFKGIIFSKTILLFLIISLNFLTYNLAHAWTRTLDFESETVGAVIGGSGTTVSDVRAHSGTKSVRVMFPAGSDCWAVCGGNLPYGGTVYEGGEIWARGYYYFASPWSWSSSPVVKVFRLRMATASNDSSGYMSAFSEPQGRIVGSNEPSPWQPTTTTYYTIDGWQSIEIYVKLSSVTGQGIFRIWKDGILIVEDKTRATLNNSTDMSTNGMYFTYWNGGVPQTQYAWVDDFVITTDRPSNQDANGNYMIGPSSSSSSSSTLAAPSGLTIK